MSTQGRSKTLLPSDDNGFGIVASIDVVDAAARVGQGGCDSRVLPSSVLVDWSRRFGLCSAGQYFPKKRMFLTGDGTRRDRRAQTERDLQGC